MTFETLGGSFKTAVGETTDYHNTIFAGDKIWVFSKTHVEQPTYNWGHRVTLAGGHAIAFDVNEKKWGERKEFPALTTDENSQEAIFVLDGAVHLLLAANYGKVEFTELFKWTGDEWTKVPLQVPESLTHLEEKDRVDIVVAEGTSNDRYIVTTVSRVINLYKLSGGDEPTLEHVVEVPADVNIMHGQAVSAMHSGRKVLVFFGVHGCGFRWEKNRLITYDEDTQECKHVEIPGDYTDGPPFSFTGASGRGVAPNGDWIHAGGSVQVGMCDSKYTGSVWSLTNLATSPEWKNLNKEVPEACGHSVVVDTDKGILYAVGENVIATSIE